jgi:hypothetical protein
VRAGIVLLAAWVLQVAATQGPEGTAVVRGRVVDAVTGRPLRNVAIQFHPEPRRPFKPGINASLPKRTAMSDARGIFEVANLPAAGYRIYGGRESADYLDIDYGARGPGSQGRVLDVADGARLDLTLQTWPGASIAGRVIDKRGRPVVGAVVQLASPISRPSGVGMTDDRGEYLLARLAPGEYSAYVLVGMWNPTLASAAPVRSPSADPPPLRPYLLDRAARTILVPDGAPLPAPSPDGRLNLYLTSYYGGTGRFDAKYFVLGVGQKRTGVDIVLRDEPGFRISGIIAGPGGPIAGASLTLVRDGVPDTYENGWMKATAAADGSFVFVAAPAGSYRLIASRLVPTPTEVSLVDGAPAFENDHVVMRDTEAWWADVPLAVGADDIDGVQVTLRPGIAVTGRFVFEDQVPADLRRPDGVVLERLEAEPGFNDAILPAGPENTFAGRARPGRYHMDVDVLPGWTFKTARLNGRDIVDGPIVLGDSPAGELEIVYGRGTTSIQGRVVDARGNPSADGGVVVFPVDPARWGRVEDSNRGRRVRVTAANYETSGLIPGEYYVAAFDAPIQRGALTRVFFERAVARSSRVQLHPGEPVTLNLTLRAEKTPR